MSDIWEPWVPEIGQRVRVRLSGECRVEKQLVTPPPHVSDDEVRRRTFAGEDVATIYSVTKHHTDHPEQFEGETGTVALVDRSEELSGHYYRVMFDRLVQPGRYLGVDLAAVELEPVS